MRKIMIIDFRINMGRYIEEAKQGSVFTLTKYGRPIAVLGPAKKKIRRSGRGDK